MSVGPEATQRLPSGWCWATVNDLGLYINGLAFKPSDWEPTGRPIIRIQNLTRATAHLNRTTKVVAPQFVVEDGDILVSWSATLDAFIWRGPEAVLNQHIFKVVPDRALPSRTFVFWGLRFAINQMWESEHTHGTTMRHINRGPFLAHQFALPPAREQFRIADALESYSSRLDDAVATLQRVERNLERYRASVLKAAVEGRLVPTEASLAKEEGRDYEPASVLLERILTERRRRWAESGKRGKYQEPTPPDTSKLPELPEGWCWATIDILSEVKGGITKGQQRKPGTAVREVPYLRVANVQRGALDLSDVKLIEATQSEIDELRLCRATCCSTKAAIATSLGAVGSGRASYPSAFTRITFFAPDS